MVPQLSSQPDTRPIRLRLSDSTLTQGCQAVQAALRRGLRERNGQLQLYAAAERLQRALGSISIAYTECLAPTSKVLGSRLQIHTEACTLFPEEVRLSFRVSGQDLCSSTSACNFAFLVQQHVCYNARASF